MELIITFRERIEEMGMSNRIALMLRIGATFVAFLCFVDGKPPASAQLHTSTSAVANDTAAILRDEQRDVQLGRIAEWQLAQEKTNSDVSKHFSDTDVKLDTLANNVSDLQGRVTGGFGLLTILSGLAVFFQLKKNSKSTG